MNVDSYGVVALSHACGVPCEGDGCGVFPWDGDVFCSDGDFVSGDCGVLMCVGCGIEVFRVVAIVGYRYIDG